MYGNSEQYKTIFGGITQLKACDSTVITSPIEDFYKNHKFDLMKIMTLISDGASVMAGKVNGVEAQLKRTIHHLVQQHWIAHREDLGISSA